MSKHKVFLILGFGACLLSAQSALADAAKGKELFDKLCVSCHGATGMGDGPVGMALPANQKPRNFQTEEMKFATSEAKFKELLEKGGAAVGLNPLMAMQAGLSDEEVKSLYEFVESLKK